MEHDNRADEINLSELGQATADFGQQLTLEGEELNAFSLPECEDAAPAISALNVSSEYQSPAVIHHHPMKPLERTSARGDTIADPDHEAWLSTARMAKNSFRCDKDNRSVVVGIKIADLGFFFYPRPACAEGQRAARETHDENGHGGLLAVSPQPLHCHD
jgi:hypothetical protein